MVEQPIRNRQVIGSSPIVGSSFYAGSKHLHVDTIRNLAQACAFYWPFSGVLSEIEIFHQLRGSFRVADHLLNESDTSNTRLIDSGNPLTVCLPDARHKAVSDFLAIGLVAFQIACQQLLLAKDAQDDQAHGGQTYEKATNGAEQQRAADEP